MVVRTKIRARIHHPRHGAGELYPCFVSRESCTLHSLARLRVFRVPRLTSGWERILIRASPRGATPVQV